MRKHPKAFDDLFVNMIAAGEAGGILDTILKRLATYIEKAVKLKGQVKGAMVYPVAVISIAAIVIAVIMWKVIPTFASMFEGLGADLPLPTRIVIAISNWFVRLLPFLVIGAILFVIFFKRYYATHGGRRVIDRLVLKLPIIGVLMQKIAVARFCRTLATLVSSGVPILDGLEITARTSGNAIIEDAIMAVRKGVEGGLDHRPAAQGERRLPAHGGADDRGGRADGRAGRHARQDRRLLRGGGGPGRGQPPDPHGAGHDPLPGDHGGRHRHRHVPAALRPDQQADVGWAARRRFRGGGPRRRLRAMDPALDRRLKLLMLIRLVMVTTLLLVAAYVEAVSENLLPINPLYFLIVCTYALTVIHAVMLRFVSRAVPLVFGQVVGDLLVITGLVYVTGGVRTGFMLLYPISVLSGAVLLYRRAGVVLAGLATLFYAAIIWAVRAGWVPPQGLSDVPYLSSKALVYSIFVTGVACTTVALIGSYLSESLKRWGSGWRRRWSRWRTWRS